jgi:hypothetical protein
MPVVTALALEGALTMIDLKGLEKETLMRRI